MSPSMLCGRMRVRVFLCFLLAVFAVSACNRVTLWEKWQDIPEPLNCTHEWGVWSVHTSATCIETGTGIRACTICQATETEIPIDPDAHDWDYALGATAPTCTTAGNGDRECTLCLTPQAGGIYPKLGHDPGNWVQTTEPTCTEYGIATGTCARDGCSHPNDPHNGEAPLGHSWIDNWAVKTSAACEATGEDERICNRDGCTHPETRVASAFGHAPGNWSQTTPPTCTDAGTEAGTCTRDNCSHPETRVAPALGHDLGAWEPHGVGEERRDCLRGSCDHQFTVKSSAISGTSISLRMAHIPAGTFEMGQTGVATPVHSVTLTRGFYMGIYPVTQEQYAAVMTGNENGLNASPSSFSGSPADGEVQARRPVEQVSWYDALVFCNRLSLMEGLTPVYSIEDSTDPANWGNVPTSSDAEWNAVTVNWDANGYRLPTEAEWEYACRAGTTTLWYTGNTEDAALQAAAWYSANSTSRTREVGLKTPNAWGLYDMTGNVRAWCWDWLGSYTSVAKTDPVGSATGTDRVIRGGSWNWGAPDLRTARRLNLRPVGSE